MKKLELDSALIQCAYRKLKTNAYFDKSSAPLRNQIVEYEMNSFQNSLRLLRDALNDETGVYWNSHQKKLIDTIEYMTLPKSYKQDDDRSPLIINYKEKISQLSKYQYYIHMDVSAHIIGVLWLLTIGKMIDESMYPHSYGNRLHSKLVKKDGDYSESSILFQPYFKQYGSWRDRALKLAESLLAQKEDVFLLTLDFQSFYYSVNLNQKQYDALLDQYLLYNNIDSNDNAGLWVKRTHEFVWNVIKQYTTLLKRDNVVLEHDTDKKERTISPNIKHLLPIGFLPSNVLSNWVLANFDKAIVDQWNPVYYGRYVDDIIILDKAPQNSDIYMKARQIGEDHTSKLNSNDIISQYLRTCMQNSVNASPCVADILKHSNTGYCVNHTIINMPGSSIKIQQEKVKTFYFRHDSSKSLITKFREDIAKNASEFRILPEMDEAVDFDNYSSILDISRSDTINKLCGIDSVSINRFELSKFLGKYSRIRLLVSEEMPDSLELELLKMLDSSTLLINYTLWDRLLEIFIIAGKWDAYGKTIENLHKTIMQVEIHGDCNKRSESLRNSLCKFLHAAINRTSALVWDKGFRNSLPTVAPYINTLDSMRVWYVKTRMINKTCVPILSDKIYDSNPDTLEKENISLTRFEDCLKLLSLSKELCMSPYQEYSFYPFWVTPSERAYAQICKDISQNGTITTDDGLVEFYQQHADGQGMTIEVIPRNAKQEIIHIPSSARPSIKVAIGNAAISESHFEDVLKLKNLNSFSRYKQFAQIIDEAIRERCDLLVLPELYTPLEWLPILIHKCAKVQMALVTGIDVVIGGAKDNNTGNIYNLTATILPYEIENTKGAYVSYHHKVHYAPAEEELIEKYGYTPKKGETYRLYNWHGIWFAVYCCFELACIQDRALFNSLSDITIGVEFNKDIPYFENLSNSLSRDLHCYVIQANTAQFGGSGVIQPKSSVDSRKIWTKGGDNFTILTTTIDVHALRESQYPLKGNRKPFKPLPPITNRKYIEARYKGTLWEVLKNEKNTLGDSAQDTNKQR